MAMNKASCRYLMAPGNAQHQVPEEGAPQPKIAALLKLQHARLSEAGTAAHSLTQTTFGERTATERQRASATRLAAENADENFDLHRQQPSKAPQCDCDNAQHAAAAAGVRPFHGGILVCRCVFLPVHVLTVVIGVCFGSGSLGTSWFATAIKTRMLQRPTGSDAIHTRKLSRPELRALKKDLVKQILQQSGTNAQDGVSRKHKRQLSKAAGKSAAFEKVLESTTRLRRARQMSIDTPLIGAISKLFGVAQPPDNAPTATPARPLAQQTKGPTQRRKRKMKAPQDAPTDAPAPAAIDASTAIAAAAAAPTGPSPATTTTTAAGADASGLSNSDLLERLRIAEATISAQRTCAEHAETERDSERAKNEDSARRHEKQMAALKAGHRTRQQRSFRRFFTNMCRAWLVGKRQQREAQAQYAKLHADFLQVNEEWAEEADAVTADRVELSQLRKSQTTGGQQQLLNDATRALQSAQRENPRLQAELHTRDGVHARLLKTLGGNADSSDEALASAAVAFVLAHEAQPTARVTADAWQHRRALSADSVFMKRGILRRRPKPVVNTVQPDAPRHVSFHPVTEDIESGAETKNWRTRCEAKVAAAQRRVEEDPESAMQESREERLKVSKAALDMYRHQPLSAEVDRLRWEQMLHAARAALAATNIELEVQVAPVVDPVQAN
ncbi:hypothetical protein JKP88DRAFT_321919 [Tribonema minus]|uniref:Uncharacterized protein n=1 Tax=Tribonema minus TaxID=303371 RepID=A0A835YTN9_9STRA|nr:hypothetical protein JKP88DRAFT_321919 [Tribonema minus]